MKIEHVALYVNDLENARDFFVKYLGARQMTDIITRKRISARISFRLMTARGLSL